MYHKSNLNRIIADYCGQPLSKIEADTDRDNYMSPIEAREYGIIDHIVVRRCLIFNTLQCVGVSVGYILTWWLKVGLQLVGSVQVKTALVQSAHISSAA